jgi:hypothetical protein
MIMKAKAMIRRALDKAATPMQRVAHAQGTPMPSGTPALTEWERDVLAVADAVLPVAPGHDDTVMIFRRALLQREATGATLRDVFDRMYAAHPQVAGAVAQAGSGGRVMWERAMASLTTYQTTGVASAPVIPLSL